MIDPRIPVAIRVIIRRLRAFRLPRVKFHLKWAMLAVAIVAILIGFIRNRQAAPYREVLEAYSFNRHYRSHHSREGKWRSYIEECRAAEEYLGITPRHFEPGGKIWKEMEEHEKFLEDLRLNPQINSDPLSSEDYPR
jgi:hypothetical protein